MEVESTPEGMEETRLFLRLFSLSFDFLFFWRSGEKEML